MLDNLVIKNRLTDELLHLEKSKFQHNYVKNTS